mgnify:CR=1 FL=1
MAQDIRKLMQTYEPSTTKMPEGHESVFKARLDMAFPPQNKTFIKQRFYLKLALVASITLLLGIWGLSPLWKVSSDIQPTQARTITLGDISPELKKVETFYQSGINLQLASLKITPENKAIIDRYLSHLSELDRSYEKWTQNLNENGPSEATLTALIENLKLRLDLLITLKNELKTLKEKENETLKTNHI